LSKNRLKSPNSYHIEINEKGDFMLFLILAVFCSVAVSVLLKVARSKQIVIEQAKSFGIHAIRIPDESTGFMNYMYSPIRFLGKVGLSTVAANARPIVRNNNMLTTQYFWGMVNGGNIDQKLLIINF